ncbi:MAG: restriction endonuclease [Ignavibacteria bacterium]|nr:restriction endonuclease [Ignavibacteria bacterium]
MLDYFNKKQLQQYSDLLKVISSLSNLFSESSIPYLNYRVAENIFCKAFNAVNLSRSDGAFDARIKKLGIGIKTFISNGEFKSEKIAEFNTLSNKLRKFKNEDLAIKLANIRNERINFATRTYKITKGIYHCITRREKKLIIFDTAYDLINVNKIKIISESGTSINFRDNLNEYTYNYSKSTLYKKFYMPNDIHSIDVKILDDPFEILLNLLSVKDYSFNKQIGIAGKDYVVLPLYALKYSNKNKKVVADHSGLNQWNAKGRKRKAGEVYIPVPKAIHKNFPGFFPTNEVPFSLEIPSGEIFDAKICQQDDKALMTNPNDALEKWMLRNVLDLDEGELLNYEKLEEIGVDSVYVNKVKNKKYTIDFAPLNCYDDFKMYMR